MGAVLGKIVYWVAVVAVSILLVLGLILWFESRDDSRLEGAGTSTALT